MFRYEKPQRGRLREHFQLNVDLFGAEGNEADAEIISVAYEIMKKFGATDNDFLIKINNRKLLNDLYAYFKMTPEESQKVSKIIDKKEKISKDVFETSVKEVIGERMPDFVRILTSNEKLFDTLGKDNPNAKEIVDLIEKLESIGITNVSFEPTLMRGFDYYTGIVFEVFDTHPDNNRSVFGGGRYDDLLEIFGADKVPTIGFGAGDVTARDFLETHNLLPQYKPSAQIYICTLGTEFSDNARKLAETLRKKNIHVAIDLSSKKVGDQIKTAHRQNIPYVICIGENEVTSGMYPLKKMDTGEEKNLKANDIVASLLV